MAYTKIPSCLKDSETLSEIKIYGFVTFYNPKDSSKVIKMKKIKFSDFDEEFEVKSFTKKSTKLTLDYYNQSKEEIPQKSKQSKNVSETKFLVPPQQEYHFQSNYQNSSALKVKKSKFMKALCNRSSSTITERPMMMTKSKTGISKFNLALLADVQKNHMKTNLSFNQPRAALPWNLIPRQPVLCPLPNYCMYYSMGNMGYGY